MNKLDNIDRKYQQQKVAEYYCKDAGVQYVGIQYSPFSEDLVLFNDPITQTSIAVKWNIMTVQKIRLALETRRKEFGVKNV